MIRSALLAAVCAAIACGPDARPAPGTLPVPNRADAPYELADDDDLEAVRDRFEAVPVADPTRASLRAELVAEYLRRVAQALDGGDNNQAFDDFKRAASLWRGVELRAGADVSSLGPTAARLFSIFERSGSDIEAALSLYAQIAASPETAARHRAELDLLFSYSDELAVAEYGEGAEDTRSIAVIEAVVAVFPSPAAVGDLARLYRARQAVVNKQIGRDGESRLRQLIDLQADLRFAWNLLRIHALGGHVVGAAAPVAAMSGLGEQTEVTEGLRSALSDGAAATDWITLAQLMVGEGDDPGDLAAALEIALEGIRRFPDASELYGFAGKMAAQRDQIQLAIRLLERATTELDDRAYAQLLGELYEFRVTQLSSTERPAAARRALDQFEKLYTRASPRWKNFQPDLANAYAAMGRGMVSLGELETATAYLDKSLEHRPTLEALEYLGTMALRRDQFAAAAGYLERALTLPIPKEPASQRLSIQFNHNKLMRLAGEARAGAGQKNAAIRHYLQALTGWEKLRSSGTHQLIPPFAAEALTEIGKLLWHLDKRDEAMAAFAAAQDADPTSANTYAAVVSFLVVRDRYDDALDAYHRALGSSEISDYFKVYMSLWMLAEARRAGREIDPFVRDYLGNRDGRLWQDQLARYASGRAAIADLEKRASTRGRRAELLYYKAILGASRKPARIKRLLEGVIETDMVMFFEYEMAKHWLSRGFVAER